MDEDDVGVARLAQFDGLAGADGDDVDAGVVQGLEAGQDGLQQAGVGRAGGRRQTQDLRLFGGRFLGRFGRLGRRPGRATAAAGGQDQKSQQGN